MPPDEEPRKAEHIDRMLLDTMRDMSKQLGMTVLEVSQNTTAQLARYREDIHRSIMGIHTRMVKIEERMDDDGQARKTRQGELDTVLDDIRQDQRLIQRNQWIRLVVEALLIVAALAYYLGSR